MKEVKNYKSPNDKGTCDYCGSAITFSESQFFVDFEGETKTVHTECYLINDYHRTYNEISLKEKMTPNDTIMLGKKVDKRVMQELANTLYLGGMRHGKSESIQNAIRFIEKEKRKLLEDME